MTTVFIQSGMTVRVFASFDSAKEAFNCYSDLVENHVFKEDEFPFVESGWIAA